ATGKLVAAVVGMGFYQNVVPAIPALSSEPWVWQIFGRTTSGTVTVTAAIRYYDATGALLGSNTANTTVVSTAWTRVAVNGTVPADNVAELRCEIAGVSGSTSTSYWDFGFFGRRVDLTHKLASVNTPESAVLTRSISESGRQEVRHLYITNELYVETYPELTSSVDTQFSLFWNLVSKGQTFHLLLDRGDTSEGVHQDYYSADTRLDRRRLPGDRIEYSFSGWKVGT
ncbi:MAG: hypothetical protein AAB223_11695, partial [Pseudomonadota bacterium]